MKEKKYYVGKPKNGRFYWIDLKDFVFPEWGNTKSGTPHLGLVVKINKFSNQEMYLLVPLTTNEYYYKNLGDKLVHKFDINGFVHYALISQIRTIRKARIITPLKYNDVEQDISVDNLEKIFIKIDEWQKNCLKNAINSLEVRRNE